GCSVSKKK
nr:Chain C, Calcineurin B-like protein 4 [Arabidopsis thaliana]5O9U_D Chain D, Calcineurin B-like protein 4 [Arabidopsis thaliana]